MSFLAKKCQKKKKKAPKFLKIKKWSQSGKTFHRYIYTIYTRIEGFAKVLVIFVQR